jgi:hypothetical protein
LIYKKHSTLGCGAVNFWFLGAFEEFFGATTLPAQSLCELTVHQKGGEIWYNPPHKLNKSAEKSTIKWKI